MRTQAFRCDQASCLSNDLVENNTIDRGNVQGRCHLAESQVLAKQTAVDHYPVRMLAGVPARDFVRDELGVVVAMVVMVMVMSMVMMTMIVRRYDRQVGMPWQVRVLAAGPGMQDLTKKLDHQVGGNQSITTKLPHEVPKGCA